MLHGLEGRRIALIPLTRGEGARADDAAVAMEEVLADVLGAAGAPIERITTDADDDQWHGAKYAALILVGQPVSPRDVDPRLAQLVREFLVSDKALVAIGGGVSAILAAGGVQGRHIAADEPLRSAAEQGGAEVISGSMHVDEGLITARTDVDPRELATRLVRELADRLDERALDATSEMSFPASDPPAVSPGSAGPVGPNRSEAGPDAHDPASSA